MIRTISRWLLKWWGFRIEGDVGNHFPKKVYAVVPHTSNWDFPLGILVRTAMGMRVNFVAKHTLFQPPFGFLFRWLGGYPVDRTKTSNLVDSMVEIFDREERFAVVLAPEGTRKKVKRLRTGFYHIAKGADVPLILVKFDIGNRTVVFSEPLWPRDQRSDFEAIHAFFAGAKGFIPEYGFETTNEEKPDVQ